MSLREFLERINALKRTPRMGWLEGGINPSEVEDVAQHSFETVTITLLLADSLDEGIDVERALKMAVIHDWPEAITGDFSREISEQIGVEFKENIEEKVMENLLESDISGREDYLEIWKEYSEMKTKEARIVRMADLLSILFEADGLFRRGERSEKLREIRETSREELDPFIEDFPILGDLLEGLDKSYSLSSP